MRLLEFESCYQSNPEQTYFQCAQVILMKGKITSKIFKTAVGHLIERFEILQQGVILKDSKKYFKGIENYKKIFFDSNYFEVDKKQQDWKNLFTQEIRTGSKHFLKSSKLLNELQDEYKFTCGLMWKIFLITDKESDHFEILLSIDHTIADGMSCCILMGELVKFINQINNDEEIKYELMKLPPSLFKTFENEKGDYIELSTKLCGFDFDVKKDDIFEVKQEFHFLEMNGKNLVKIAKEKKISINSIVATAMGISYMQNMCREEYGRYINVWIPISVRNLGGFDENLVGMLIGSFGTEIEYSKENLSEENFWNLASKMHQQVRKSIDEKKYLAFVRTGEFLQPKKKEISNDTLFGREPTISVSNRGRIDKFLSPTNEFDILGFYNSVHLEPLGATCQVHLSTIGDKFYFSFSTVTPIFSKERLEKFVNCSIKILENLNKINT
eukprot:gene996-9902_t